MSTLTVPARLSRPPGTANGGWLAGTPAAPVDAPTVSVRLRRPVPLDRPLSVRTDGAAELLAQAEPSSRDLEPPALPSLPEAADARARAVRSAAR